MFFRVLQTNFNISNGTQRLCKSNYIYKQMCYLTINEINYTAISCISFKIICYAMVCDFNDMLWNLYAMLWLIEMKRLMIWNAIVCYEILTKTPPYTDDFHTFRIKIIRSQSLPQIYHVNISFFQIKAFITELK